MAVPVQIPTELFESIILCVWSSPLSNGDRITFMTSAPLVNVTWKTLFTRIAFKDVHIPSPSYLHLFIAALAGYSTLLSENQCSPRLLCQSITIKVQPGFFIIVSDKYDKEPPMGKTLSNLLYFLDGIIDAPNLRTLRIEYENMGKGAFDDIFDSCRFAHFPEQVTNLEISRSFDRTYSLHATHRRQNPWTLSETEFEAYSLRHVKNLTLTGASDTFVADIISCCPGAENVTVWRASDSSLTTLQGEEVVMGGKE